MAEEENIDDLTEDKIDDLTEDKTESSSGQTDAPEEDLDDEEFDTVEWVGERDWDEEEEVEEEVVDTEPEFADNGNGTISDTKNHLMWAKEDSFAEFGYGINWFEANDYIESLNEKKFADFDDWRLCGREEAKTMFCFSKSNTDNNGAEIHIDPLFQSGGGYNTWTYEEKPDYQQYAEKFNLITGNEHWENKHNEYSHVRAVRDERKDTWEPEWRKKTKKFDG